MKIDTVCGVTGRVEENDGRYGDRVFGGVTIL